MSSPLGSSVSAASVVEVADRREFAALAPEWNALVASTNDHALHRHEFIQTWLTHFAPAATPRIITLRDEHGSLVAGLPLIEERSSMYGLPVRRLASASNEHSNRFDLVARDAPAAARRIVRHLARDPDWDVLRLAEVPETGGAMQYHRGGARGGPADGYRLEARGIETVDFWRFFHPACDPSEFPEVAALRDSVLEIPCHQDLDGPTMARVAAAVRETLLACEPARRRSACG